MEQPKADPPKLPDMIMCGDHPSFNKAELNIKEDNEDNRRALFVEKVSPSTSHTLQAASEHTMRFLEARRRVRSMDRVTPKPGTDTLPGNRALVQAALGSFRWPPYLLCIWVLVLVLTHAIHCAVTMLERALPNLKKLCTYFRAWTEQSWQLHPEYNHRVLPVALALVTSLFYTLYCALYVIHSVALWSVEPLCPETEEKASFCDVRETKVTNYIDEVNANSKTKLAILNKGSAPQ